MTLWNEMTRREQLLSEISDLHKDVYGFRPRGIYADYTEAQLEAEITELCKELEVVIDEEICQQLEAQKAFELEINSIISYGANTRASAIRWILEGEDLEVSRYDVEHLMWKRGVAFSLTDSYYQEANS